MDYYLHKYIKWKTKYLNAKRTLKQQKILEDAMEDVKIMEPNELFPLKNLNINESYTQVIAVKTANVIDKENSGYVGDVGDESIPYTFGKQCGNDPWNLSNPPYCYFFVSKDGELRQVLREKIGNFQDKDIVQQKLKEILGLLPEWGEYQYVLTIKVPTNSLIRPCFHNDTGTACKLPDHELHSDEFHTWVHKFYQESIKNKIPFTGLGYTYDWGNQGDPAYGVTEFIIKPGTCGVILSIQPLEDYLYK